MHKTIYIDIDEEITSVIDRVRKESMPDIFLVVPKNAMLTQGILNLKLLKREAEKINKNLLMVTNDKHAKKVIERAGLEISNKPVENFAENTNRNHQPTDLADRATEDSLELLNHNHREEILEELGSNSFYENEQVQEIEIPPLESNQSIKLENNKNLSISNPFNNPVVKETGPSALKQELYSTTKKEPASVSPMNNANQPMSNISSVAKPVASPVSMDVSGRSRMMGDVYKKVSVVDNNRMVKTNFGKPVEAEENVNVSQGLNLNSDWNSKKAEDFFSQSESQPIPEPAVRNQNIKKQRNINWKIIFTSFLVISLIVVGIFFVYWKFPKASIMIRPIKQTKTTDVAIKALAGADEINFETSEIPAKYEEFEVTKIMDFDSTGESFINDDGKAKGTVTILNNYSSNPQPLVATTRVLSKEGKLFHLVDTVTVPGMKADQPGKIEAEVIADKPGEDFNISSSTFTIEGFKGSPKYEKFEVTSSSAMTSGSDSKENRKAKVVLAKDIENARQTVVDELERNLETEVQLKIEPGRKAIFDSIEKEVTKVSASHKEGQPAEKFSYTVSEKVKVITFLEKDAKDLVLKTLEIESESGYELKAVKEIKYSKAIANLDKKSLEISANIITVWGPKLDAENLKTGIIGKTEPQMKEFLSNYPELDKAEIKFSPAWLNSVPVVERKIDVQVVE